MIVIDKLCYQSKLRYVNASEKFVYAVLTLALCVISRSGLTAAVVFFVNVWLTVAKGGIPFARYLKLLLIPAAFLLVSTIALVVNLSRTPLDAFAFPLGEWYLTGSVSSVLEGLRLCGKAFAAVTCLYFLSLTTVMTDILGVLKKLRIPGLVIELMMLIYRFIFLLMETASAITTSQNSRLGNRDYRTKLRSFGGMGSALLVRSLKRSGVLYDAMEARCYDGELKVLSEERPAEKKEILCIAGYEAVLLGMAIWSWVR